MATSPDHGGLRHLALRVTDLARSRRFYETLFGMRVVWEPDPENVYFSSGADNVALHQIPAAELAEYRAERGQFLDHVGVIMYQPEDVDRFYARVQQEGDSVGARIVKPPKRHRDGSYSCYIADPDGNVIQALYEPTISALRIVP
ncbi:MAG: VOC family protein [Nitrospiraceae bacterium]